MSTVSCAFFISVTVSQCRRGGEGEGVYSLQLVKGLLLTVDSGGSTVKSLQLVKGVQRGSTVYSREVYSSLGNSLYCRL